MLLALLFVAGQAAAQQVILSEDFSKCTSKDPDNPGTKMDDGMDPYTLTTGWSCVNGYAGEGNAKFGASKKGGILVTPSIDLSDASATYTLKFKACAWSKDATSLMVQVDEQEAVEISRFDEVIRLLMQANMKRLFFGDKRNCCFKNYIFVFGRIEGTFFSWIILK